MHVVLHDDMFSFQERALFCPSGDKTPCMVDDSMARICAVVFRHSKNLSYQSGIFVPPDQARDLTICGDASFRYFLNNGKYLIYQILVQDGLAGPTTPFP